MARNQGRDGGSKGSRVTAPQRAKGTQGLTATRRRRLAVVAGLAPATMIWAAAGASAGASPLRASTTITAAKARAAQLSTPSALQTVAANLPNPRHLSVGPDGALYVAEAGTGGPTSGTGANCIPVFNNQGQATTDCEGATGAIVRVTGGGSVTPVVTGLPSVQTEATATSPPETAGPSSASFTGGSLHITVQDTPPGLNPDGSSKFGAAGALLGSVSLATSGSVVNAGNIVASLSAYAAAHPVANPGGIPAIELPSDSDPYSITPFSGGYAVADAAANDLLFIAADGSVSQLASFPTQTETAPAGVLGPTPVTAAAQAVPTSVVVGPDGALYVGELVGLPSNPGTAVVYRVVPGQQPSVYASGFSAVTDIAFDRAGRLLVLEYNTQGLLDRTGASGAVLRVERDGSRSMLASTGLVQPTGIAVGADGTIYVSNHGDSAAGEVDAIHLSATDGYQEVAADGGVFSFGSYGFYGSTGGMKLNNPIVTGISTAAGPAYWLVASDGGVFSFGGGSFYGSTGGMKLNDPVVGAAATPDGHGYWLVASDGGVFSFGDAQFHGSTGAMRLNKPIVGMASTPDGGGYWLVASDGGVFSFGDAQFHGSTGAMRLNKPIVGMASTPDGGGYWLVASDGGVFSFGDANFYGSTGAMALNKPVVGIASTADGAGYELVAADGGVFNFGDSSYYGSSPSLLSAPIVALNR